MGKGNLHLANAKKGDIIVRTRGTYSSKIGRMYRVVSVCTPINNKERVIAYYNYGLGGNLNYNSGRLASEEEVEAYIQGIRNINNIPKIPKLYQIF